MFNIIKKMALDQCTDKRRHASIYSKNEIFFTNYQGFSFGELMQAENIDKVSLFSGKFYSCGSL